MKKETKRLLLLHIAVALGVSVYMLVMTFSGIHCPIRAITGIPCPTCGFTRAALALLQGDIMRSLHIHPMLLPVVVSCLLFFHARPLKLSQRLTTAILLAVAAATFGLYLFRLFTHALPV
ncbi:MAG: DUF2752 domain-containing protein [Clostridiales bacterium]|nr:DUF2752 domain-containing protein [Clostridiales bacterium]